MRLTGKQTWVFQNNIFVNATGTAVGPKEAEGPLGKCFDISYDDLHCEEENWELAERRLMNDSIQQVIQKGDIKPSQIDFFSGRFIKPNRYSKLCGEGAWDSFFRNVQRLCIINGDTSDWIGLY